MEDERMREMIERERHERKKSESFRYEAPGESSEGVCHGQDPK